MPVVHYTLPINFATLRWTSCGLEVDKPRTKPLETSHREEHVTCKACLRSMRHWERIRDYTG